jgi:hypothetical protein
MRVPASYETNNVTLVMTAKQACGHAVPGCTVIPTGSKVDSSVIILLFEIYIMIPNEKMKNFPDN